MRKWVDLVLFYATAESVKNSCEVSKTEFRQ